MSVDEILSTMSPAERAAVMSEHATRRTLTAVVFMLQRLEQDLNAAGHFDFAERSRAISKRATQKGEG